MNEQVLQDFYWDVLARADRGAGLYKGEAVPKELATIRALACAGSIRRGAQFQVYHQDHVDEQAKKKAPFFSVTSAQKEVDAENLPAKIIFKDLAGKEYSCTETELRNVIHSEYDRVILHAQGSSALKEAGTGNVPTIPTVLPELQPPKKEDQEGQLMEQPQTAGTDEKEEPVVQDVFRLPFFGFDRRYPKDPTGYKGHDTFYFNRHDLTVSSEQGTGTIHFYVYPLSIRENERATDIMVVAESGEICRAAISRGIGSSVEIEFAGIPFVVRGSFENNLFLSSVNVLDDKRVRTEGSECIGHPAGRRTSCTYVQVKTHGIQLFVFPASPDGRNGSSGYAPAAIIVNRGDDMDCLTPTSEGTFIVETGEFDRIGNRIRLIISTYWFGRDNDFHVDIETE